MPTPAERKALLFFSVVATLGGGVRAVGAVRGGAPPPAEARAALARQLAAVESVRAREREQARERVRRGAVGRRRRARAEWAERAGERAAGVGVSVPTPGGGSSVAGARAPTVAAGVVDVDRATAAELEALPRIGPTLARRIVADRDSLGPFGSLAGLQRVRGVGPALARTLADRVTFSGRPRLPAGTPGGATPVGGFPERPPRGRRPPSP